MARKGKKYHYIYKITCLKNNRYYIGMHSTDNLEDGYMGGGIRIKNSIKKHGNKAHKKEILEFLENRDLLKNREKEIINEELLQDPMCMNLALGGEGGWDNSDPLKQKEKWKKALNRMEWLMNNDPEWAKKRLESLRKTGSDNFKKMHTEGKVNYDTFSGKKHNVESKKKIGEKNSINQKGEKNSRFGTMWIYNNDLKINKTIKKNDPIPDGWVKGRKMIFL